MGNVANHPQPTANVVTDLELRLAPHNFYLVFGKPSIQFARDRTRGPLIYDVEVEYDENIIEHAATLDLTCAVPRRQNIELISTPPPSPNTVGGSQGFALRFQIAATHPPQRVRVYAGVSVEYRVGDGVRLKNRGVVEAGSLCIFDTTETSGLTTVITNPLVLPQLLRPIEYEEKVDADKPSTLQWVTYAPLAIEVLVREAKEPLQNPQRSAPSDKPAHGASRSSSLVSSPSSTPRAKSSNKAIVQYTFLEAPEDAMKLRGSPGSGEEAQAVRRLTCKVARQLLQVGSEVYNLEDVFADSFEEDVRNPALAEENAGLCVVCLTNQKDTTILPCRHLCLCNDCAAHLCLRSNRCPLCRGNIDRVMTL
ncbi:hypothetical protein JKF63_07674 [Porcisia hertigi]|uniref:RING-type domain-containing protein n=1 Tax=Porcisia hertigi TaxID=2761500 RepID=A0A836IQI8_9TRYP|nr:hypothetical protein JKF63_07674 [Porcisia hertigi]